MTARAGVVAPGRSARDAAARSGGAPCSVARRAGVALLLVAFAGALGACGEDVVLGRGASGGSGASGAGGACAGKSCGQSCIVDDCAGQGGADCVGPAVAGYCDANGSCTASQ